MLHKKAVLIILLLAVAQIEKCNCDVKPKLKQTKSQIEHNSPNILYRIFKPFITLFKHLYSTLCTILSAPKTLFNIIMKRSTRGKINPAPQKLSSQIEAENKELLVKDSTKTVDRRQESSKASEKKVKSSKTIKNAEESSKNSDKKEPYSKSANKKILNSKNDEKLVDSPNINKYKEEPLKTDDIKEEPLNYVKEIDEGAKPDDKKGGNIHSLKREETSKTDDTLEEILKTEKEESSKSKNVKESLKTAEKKVVSLKTDNIMTENKIDDIITVKSSQELTTPSVLSKNDNINSFSDYKISNARDSMQKMFAEWKALKDNTPKKKSPISVVPITESSVYRQSSTVQIPSPKTVSFEKSPLVKKISSAISPTLSNSLLKKGKKRDNSQDKSSPKVTFDEPNSNKVKISLEKDEKSSKKGEVILGPVENISTNEINLKQSQSEKKNEIEEHVVNKSLEESKLKGNDNLQKPPNSSDVHLTNDITGNQSMDLCDTDSYNNEEPDENQNTAKVQIDESIKSVTSSESKHDGMFSGALAAVLTNIPLVSTLLGTKQADGLQHPSTEAMPLISSILAINNSEINPTVTPPLYAASVSGSPMTSVSSLTDFHPEVKKQVSSLFSSSDQDNPCKHAKPCCLCKKGSRPVVAAVRPPTPTPASRAPPPPPPQPRPVVRPPPPPPPPKPVARPPPPPRAPPPPPPKKTLTPIASKTKKVIKQINQKARVPAAKIEKKIPPVIKQKLKMPDKVKLPPRKQMPDPLLDAPPKQSFFRRKRVIATHDHTRADAIRRRLAALPPDDDICCTDLNWEPYQDCSDYCYDPNL